MSTITPAQQAEVDESAREYVKFHALKFALQLEKEHNDRQHKAIMAAIMELSLHNTHRAQEILYQALNS